jgi:phage terminase Nu1 subunit (DNA packaging protein)
MMKSQRWWGQESGRQPKRGKIVNRNELAKLFGVVPSTINKWQDLGMPVHQKGSRGIADQFDAADCAWWRIDYRVRVATANFGDDLSLRKLSAEVELKEHARDRFMGNHMPPSMMVDVIGAAFAGVDETLAAIPDEVAPKLARESSLQTCQRIIETAINNARRKLVAREGLSSLLNRLGAGDA